MTGSGTLSWLRVEAASDLIEVSADPAWRRSIADELSVEAACDLADLAVDADPVIWAIGAQLRAAIRGARSTRWKRRRWPGTSTDTSTPAISAAVSGNGATARSTNGGCVGWSTTLTTISLKR